MKIKNKLAGEIKGNVNVFKKLEMALRVLAACIASPRM